MRVIHESASGTIVDSIRRSASLLLFCGCPADLSPKRFTAVWPCSTAFMNELCAMTPLDTTLKSASEISKTAGVFTFRTSVMKSKHWQRPDAVSRLRIGTASFSLCPGVPMTKT